MEISPNSVNLNETRARADAKRMQRVVSFGGPPRVLDPSLIFCPSDLPTKTNEHRCTRDTSAGGWNLAPGLAIEPALHPRGVNPT